MLPLTILCASLQIWDFHLGRSRGHEECGLLEAEYGVNDAGFVIKSYSELMKETSFTNTKVVGEMYDINYSMTHEDITSFNVSPSDLSCICYLNIISCIPNFSLNSKLSSSTGNFCPYFLFVLSILEHTKVHTHCGGN